MSSPIQLKVTNALKALARAHSAEELNPALDATQTNAENAIACEAMLSRVQKEVKFVATHLDEVRIGLEAWSTLIQKMGTAEREDESKAFERYHKAEKIADKLEQGNEKHQKLQDKEAELVIKLKLYQSRADRDQRAADLQHTRDLTAAAHAPSGSAAMPLMANQTPLYQLQTLQIPKFAGGRKAWPSFYESFKSAIEGRTGTKAEKLNLLRSFLEGEAKQLIAGLQLKDSNFDVAINLLVEQYGEKEKYVEELHDEMAKLRICTNLRESKEFLFTVERLCRELENAGENVEGAPTYLALEKKLTPALLRTILTKKTEDPANWNTSKFREVLSEAIKRESTIQEVMGEYGHRKGFRPSPPHSRPRNPPFKRDFKREHTFIQSAMDVKPQGNKPLTKATARPQQSNRTQQTKPRPPLGKPLIQARQYAQPKEEGGKRKPPSPCVFCGNSHWSDECQKHPTAQSRMALVHDKGLCYKCLKSNHMARDCPRPAKCYICKAFHPTALCRQPKKAPTKVNAAVESAQTEQVEHAASAQQLESINATRDESKKALLMTVKATVFNPVQPERSMVANIFIDGGSHRSFVSAEAARNLNLPIIQHDPCYLTSFGEKEARRYDSDLVKLGFLCTNGDQIIINLNKLKFLVSDMPIIKVSDIEEKQLRQHRLNPPHDYKQPDIRQDP